MTIEEICDYASRKIAVEIPSLPGIAVLASRIAHNAYNSMIQGNKDGSLATERVNNGISSVSIRLLKRFLN